MWEKYSNLRINMRKRRFIIGNDNEYSFFKNGDIADKSMFSAEFGDVVKSSGADSDEEARCLKEHIRQKYREMCGKRYGGVYMIMVMFLITGLLTALMFFVTFKADAAMAVLTVMIDAALLFVAVLMVIGNYRIKTAEKKFFANAKVTSYEFTIDEVIRFSIRYDNSSWMIRFGGSNYFYVGVIPNLPFERGDIFNCDVAESGDKIILFWTNGNAEKMWNWGYRLSS